MIDALLHITDWPWINSFIQVGVMFAVLIVFFGVPIILQAKCDKWRGKKPLAPRNDCDCDCHRSWDWPVF